MRPAQKAPENAKASNTPSTSTRDFNEAGAKSAGKRRGRLRRARPLLPTSMRPAQKAPENRRIRTAMPVVLSHFNEAGAKSAGKRG